MATRNWLPGDGDVSDPTRWDQAVPQQDDIAAFASGTGVYETVQGDAGVGALLAVGDDRVTLTGTVTLTGNAGLVDSYGNPVAVLVNDPSSGGGALTVADTATLDAGAGTVVIGDGAGPGALLVQGHMSAGDVLVAGADSRIDIAGYAALFTASGTITIDAGTLSLAIASLVAPAVVVRDGGTLRMLGPVVGGYGGDLVLSGGTLAALFFSADQALALPGNITLADSNTVIGDAGSAIILSGAISDGGGTGTLVVAGGDVVLTGHNAYSGGTMLQAGTLTLAQPDAAGTGAVRFTGMATLELGQGLTGPIYGFAAGDAIHLDNVVTAGAVLPGAGNSLTFMSTQQVPVTLRFDPGQSFAANSFLALADAAGGTDIVLGPEELHRAILGGQLGDVGGWTGNGAASTDIPAAGTGLVFDTGAAPYTVGGDAVFGAASILGDNVTFTGRLTALGLVDPGNPGGADLRVIGGRLGFSGGGYVGSGSIAVTSGGTLAALGGATIQAGAMQVGEDGTGGEVTIVAASLSLDAMLAIGAGATLELGAGAQLAAATLQLAAGTLLLDATPQIGALITVVGSASITATGDATLAADIALPAGAPLTLAAAAGQTLTIAGDIGGDGEVVIDHGSVAMSGSKTFTGDLRVFGTLDVTADLQAGTGTVDVLAGGTLKLAAGVQLFNPVSIYLGGRLDFAGIDNATAVTLTDGNLLVLTLANGGTHSLQLSPAETFPGQSFHLEGLGADAVVTLTQDRFQLAGPGDTGFQQVGGWTRNDGPTASVPGPASLVVFDAATPGVTVAGDADMGQIRMTGGAVILDGSIALSALLEPVTGLFSGLDVAAGTLTLAGGSAVTDRGTTLVDGTLVVAADASLSSTALQIRGTVTLQGGAVTVGPGSASLLGGTLALDAASSFAADLSISGGSLRGLAGLEAGAGAVVAYAGAITAGAATLSSAAAVTLLLTGGLNAASLTIAGGHVALATTTSQLGAVLLQSGTLDLQAAGVTASSTIAFAGAATLQIEAGALPAGAVTGFSLGDTIAFAADTLSIDSYDGTALVLEVDGQATTLDLVGSFHKADFAVSHSAGMELLTSTVPCFCRGTRIRTPDGDRAVEDIAVGDRVSTLLQGEAVVRWVGRRGYDGRFVAGNTGVLPIRIAPGALADGCPSRPLFVSPEHALLVEGMLVPAAGLLNGVSITQLEQVDRVEYFHIELYQHDILFAEGAAAESFLDEDNRGMFHNAEPQVVMFPAPLPCAPRLQQGAQLETIRQRLLARVQGQQPMESGRLDGFLDRADRIGLTGWAMDLDNPGCPVLLEVLDHDRVIGQVTANRFGSDLLACGIGNGRHGFDVQFAVPLAPLEPHCIRVRRVSDLKELHRSGIRFGGLFESPTGVLEAATRALDDMVRLQSAGAEASARLDSLLDTTLELTKSLRAARAKLAGPSEAARDDGGQLAFGPVLSALHLNEDRLRWALVIDHAVPRAGHDGGSNAMLSHIASLQRLGWRVAFLSPPALADAGSVATQLEKMGVWHLRAPHYASAEEALARHPRAFDLVYLHRVSSAARYTALVRLHQPRARLVYSVADLHHLRLARQAAVLDQPGLAQESLVVQRAEYAAVQAADHVITHSDIEAALLRRAHPHAAISVVPWAVPLSAPLLPMHARLGVAFVAGFAHAPNHDAALWLLREIMPLVWREAPEMRCVIAGSDMPQGLRRLTDTRVEALGEVADLLDVFWTVRLTVAPLRFGAGVKAKVLDSLAAGLPCVCTPVAAEGLGFGPDLAEWVGNDAAALAAKILRLHEDPVANSLSGLAGLDLVARHHDTASVDAAMAKAVGHPIRHARPEPLKIRPAAA